MELYSVGIDLEDANKAYIYEVWENEEAHQKSFSLDVFKKLITKAKSVITGMSDYPSLIIKGGKGIK